MCFKCTKQANNFVFCSQGSGKTLALAEYIANCDDISDDFTISKELSDWATYFFKNTPITKSDLREALNIN